MARKLKLTRAEWEIMEAVWKLGGSPSVRDVLEHAYPNGEKAYTTVQTVMNTLERKGLLGREKIGLVNFYTPLRPREHLVKAEIRSIVSRIFDGSIPAVANSLLSLDDLTIDEIEEIKRIVSKKERELKGGRS
ncbi:MAG: BlaI/MecI/CopY family transcriptional regulator [bacterium]|nr:MAG: BlaI/MecI/CopY family transcriptional regulator [bacterium]